MWVVYIKRYFNIEYIILYIKTRTVLNTGSFRSLSKYRYYVAPSFIKLTSIDIFCWKIKKDALIMIIISLTLVLICILQCDFFFVFCYMYMLTVWCPYKPIKLSHCFCWNGACNVCCLQILNLLDVIIIWIIWMIYKRCSNLKHSRN